jgi:hypothetical protein
LPYRNVIKVWQQKVNADNRDQRQEDTAHRRSASSALVDFASSIATEGWQSHEHTTDQICHTKCNELAIGRGKHSHNAVTLVHFLHCAVTLRFRLLFNLARCVSETLRGDATFKEAEQGDN